MKLVSEVREYLARLRTLPAGSRVLCAVSGGPDSMAMLHALCALRRKVGFELGVAYVNHGLRRRAKTELKFVGAQARKVGVPFHAASVDVRRWARLGKKSVEAAARDLRYAALALIARRNGYDRIATAHTADDQAETVLMHVISGTGLDGLAGIRPEMIWDFGFGISDLSANKTRNPNPKSVMVVRPLLSVTRKDVEAFLRAKKIPSMTDETNRDPRFDRNRVRRKLLPLIRKSFNPSVVSALSRLAENAREESEALESLADAAFRGAVSERGGGLTLDRKKLGTLPAAIRARVLDRALRRAAPGVRFDRVHLDALSEKAVGGTGTSYLDLPGGVHATITYRSVTLSPRPSQPVRIRSLNSQPSTLNPLVVVPGPGLYDVPWAGVTFRFGRQGRGALHSTRIDRTAADYPFMIRPFRPGDRIAPPFARHTRKLKKIFIDKKIPRDERARLPILCHGETVVWVPGVTEIAGMAGKRGKIEVDVGIVGVRKAPRR